MSDVDVYLCGFKNSAGSGCETVIARSPFSRGSGKCCILRSVFDQQFNKSTSQSTKYFPFLLKFACVNYI